MSKKSPFSYACHEDLAQALSEGFSDPYRWSLQRIIMEMRIPENSEHPSGIKYYAMLFGQIKNSRTPLFEAFSDIIAAEERNSHRLDKGVLYDNLTMFLRETRNILGTGLTAAFLGLNHISHTSHCASGATIIDMMNKNVSPGVKKDYAHIAELFRKYGGRTTSVVSEESLSTQRVRQL